MKQFIGPAVFVLLFSQVLFAQRMERPAEGQRPGFILYDAIDRAGEDSLRSRVDIPYRIDHEFFIPVKNDDSSIHWPFVRRGEVAIDLIDSLGTSRARAISEVVIGQISSERTPDQKQWYQGVSSFLVPPGPYTVQVEVTDLESQRNVLEKQRKIRVARFSLSRFTFSAVGFVDGEPGTPVLPEAGPGVSSGERTRFPDTLTLQNFGGDLLFGSPASLLLEVDDGKDSTTPLRVSWVIKQIGGDREVLHEVARDSSARIVTLAHFRIDSVFSENGIRYLIKSDTSSRRVGVLVSIPAEQLPLRMFSLDLNVSAGTREEHRSIPFRTVWPTMPLSLRDVDLALNALRFIVSPQVLDSLTDGSFDERRDHLEQFWKSRDKTPGTARNELMTEYYRRVDYAMRNFGTLRIPDGSRTDRGKIYILYGPPTSTNRSLDPLTGYQETWIYERLGKKFVFKDQSKSGNYILSSTTGL